MARPFLFRAITIDYLSPPAMSNAYMSRLCSIHHPAAGPLPSSRNLVLGIFRCLSSCTSLDVSHSSPLTTTQISASDMTQRSAEWFALRKDKLTSSTFSTALGFWKKTRRVELWSEKVFSSESQVMEASKRTMEWGVLNEGVAVESYKTITGHDLSYMGFAIHPDKGSDWLGASPDGLLSCSPENGILEVKCPFNKGKPESASPWSTVPFYYMPQVQGQMEILNREWVDMYCWTPNASSIFRVHREPRYWNLIHGILHEFWWEHVIPAREALLVSGEEAANYYKPAPTHKRTGELIVTSIKLAAEAKLLCKETSGQIELCEEQTLKVQTKQIASLSNSTCPS